MRIAFGEKLTRTGINIFFVYLALATLVNGLIDRRASRNWLISDWLTNYQGGFVRRGLPGEVAFIVAKALHIDPIPIVVVFYLALFAAFFIAARELALRSSRNLWLLALILSPATLSFQILHPLVGFRKELIFIAALSVFLVLLQRFEVSSLAAIVYMTVAIVVGALSHEGLIFYAPYFFAALVLSGRPVQRASTECIIPFVLGVIAVCFCSRHLGDVQIAKDICSSLGYKFLVPGSTDICSSGAIPYLIRDGEFAHAEVLANIHDYRYFAVFPPFAALALLPALGESVFLTRAKLSFDVIVIWTICLLSFCGSIFLFRYGFDWGRWIYIHICSLMVLFLFADAKAVAMSSPVLEPVSASGPGRKIVYGAFLFCYAFLWILPSGAEPIRMGYAGRFLYLLHNGTHPRDVRRARAE